MALFKGGTLVTGLGTRKADLRTQGEKIGEVAPDLLPQPGEEVHDISGKLLLPGIIDAHTHFLLKSRNSITADDAYSASRAAALGGVTTVIDYADLLPHRPMVDGIEVRRQDFLETAVDYSFHLVVNDHYHPELAGEFAQLQRVGVSSVKLFTTYRDAGYMLPEDKWYSILEACGDMGMVVTVHAEDDTIVQTATSRGKAVGAIAPRDHSDLRPAQAEEAAVQRLIELAKATGCTIYIVHLSTGGACRLVWQARERGTPILAETTPHYLLLERSLLAGPQGSLHLMTPPLRECQDNCVLWQGVRDGIISVIATDHCAYTPEQKALGQNALDILPGIPGVETLLPLIYTQGVAQGRMGLPRLVQVLAENPAKIFGLWPRKGGLNPGGDADLVVYNPQPRWQLKNSHVHSLAGYTSYAGMGIRGRVDLTMLRGQVLTRQGKFLGRRGQGQFVAAGPSVSVG